MGCNPFFLIKKKREIRRSPAFDKLLIGSAGGRLYSLTPASLIKVLIISSLQLSWQPFSLPSWQLSWLERLS